MLRYSQARLLIAVALVAIATSVSAGPVAARSGGGATTGIAAPAAAVENDDLVLVALGTLGAAGVAAVVVTVGYLYRKQVGMTPSYDDGFTPKDPRDHPSH